jgi:beta-mannosidase
LLSIDHEPGQALNVWVVNDRIESYTGKVRLSVFDFSGTEIFYTLFDARIPSNTAVQVGSVNESDILNGRAAEEAVVMLTAEGFEAPSNLYYLRDQKDLRLPAASLQVEANEQEQTVKITAVGGLARMVKIDLPQGNLRLSDNFFDLLPGETMTVRISRPDGTAVPFKGLKVSALNLGTLEFS